MPRYLIDERKGTRQKLIAQTCPKCNQVFSDRHERCPNCNCSLSPVWGEEEKIDAGKN